MKLINKLFAVLIFLGMSNASFAYFISFMNRTHETVNVKVDFSGCDTKCALMFEKQELDLIKLPLRGNNHGVTGRGHRCSGKLCSGTVSLNGEEAVKIEYPVDDEYIRFNEKVLGKETSIIFDITYGDDKTGPDYLVLSRGRLR